MADDPGTIDPQRAGGVAPPALSVCILTFNSIRTLEPCLAGARRVADELVVVDSGSTDGTREHLAAQGDVTLHTLPFETHGRQMNRAVGLARHDWVLCLDSDEILDEETAASIREVRRRLDDPSEAYRITRYWTVLGQEVHALYPVSSPDRPVRLFHRDVVRYNDRPVDDSAVGFRHTVTLEGHVAHDTFPTLEEMFGKLNGYTSRLVRHRNVRPSLASGILRAPPAFLKWYVAKGGWKDGAVGVMAGVYAALYTFLKYAKAWGRARGLPADGGAPPDEADRTSATV